jgi:hypothetical protein
MRKAIKIPLLKINYVKCIFLNLNNNFSFKQNAFQLRSFEERRERLREYVDGNVKTQLTKDEFESIPTRIISAGEF